MRAGLVFAALVAVAVGFPTHYCDPNYECSFTYVDNGGRTWEFDLSGLCRGNDYVATDAQNHTYNFNICGLSHFKCLPTWRDTYQYGVAVQSWGPTPACNSTSPKCLDPETQNYTCCSPNCEVLGVGIPVWSLMEPDNPLFGGISITHRGVPPPEDDSYKCPINPKTHQMYERTVTFNISCDTTLPPNSLQVQGAVQDTNNPCSYTILASSAATCGCSPFCDGKNCGPDGCGGFCGGLSGGCPNPSQYTCTIDQICCKPDCTFRQCGPDNCGGSCGNCSVGYQCNELQQCGALNIPSASFSVPPITPSPMVVKRYKTSTGTIAGAFFGGLLGTFAVGGAAFFLMQRRGGAQYTTALTK